MSPLKRSNNIAARMGRWSASHWKTAVFGWLAFVVAALVIGTASSARRTIDEQDANVGQAHRGRPDPQATPASTQTAQTEIVLVQSKTLDVEDPGVPRQASTTSSQRRRAVHDDQEPPLAARRRPRRPDLARRPHRAGRVGHEGHAEDRREATSTRSPPRPTKVAKAHPGFYVGEAGSVSSGKALEQDVQRAARRRPASARSR